MINPKILDALNTQVNQELNSYYLYLDMANWFAYKNLDGFAKLTKKQSDEEKSHADKIMKYITDLDEQVVLKPLQEPRKSWNTALEIFTCAYESEEKTTHYLTQIAKLAISENDLRTVSFLDWFLIEQIEEEKSTNEVMTQLKMIGDDQTGLLLLNEKLNK
ncbi:MAG TPA: ferritin [Lentisphaeria bacterium]|nr:MAG: hypothetical protein A2X47_09960 [Lentisphaerae bacterium GWF2_38_69]HBM17335.1 ferritin [Lentisphaeria bacterium]